MSKVYYNHTTKLRIVKKGYVPAATIALKMEDGKFKYGVAICSKYDNYSRKYGREIAENRLNQGFGEMEIPAPLKDLPEQEACLAQLYNIVQSVVLKNRKWKRRVTKFNLQAKVVDLKA